MSGNDNFQVYQASAGAGKTYTIVKEYLKLCLKDERQVDNFRHILAITFTNASANEMKEKIVKKLCEIKDADDVSNVDMGEALMEELGLDEARLKHHAQLLLTRIIHDYSSFCVSTIDAFVQKLSRSFAHDLGLPSQYSVSVDTDEIAETIVENIGLQIDKSNPYLVQLLLDFSANQFANERNTSLQTELSNFVKKLTEEKAYQGCDNTLTNLRQYKETLDFLNEKLSYFEEKVKCFADDYKAVEQRYGLQSDDYWQKRKGVGAFFDKLAKKDYTIPNSYFFTALEKRKCLSDSASQEANEALLAIVEPLNKFYMDGLRSYSFYKSQRDLLYLYALRTQIRLAFESLTHDDEVVHISEFNKLLHSVMGDFSVPFVYERIGEQFRHIFIDEFQDTSILQWQNLLPLVDNGLANNAMSMVVGDGKQSIYRFRSGEVGQIVKLPEIYALPDDHRRAAFLGYQQQLENGFCFHNLEYNYRSFVNVVDFNNAFFSFAVEGLPTALQKVYKEENQEFGKSVSVKQIATRKEKGLVQLELFNPKEDKAYCQGRIVELIRELTTQHGYAYKDITVLIRRKELGSMIANHLNDSGIPVVSQDSILLQSSDRVQLLVNTLRHFLQPANEVYIANVLYYRYLTLENAAPSAKDTLFKPVKAIAQGTLEMESVLGIEGEGVFRELFTKSTCLYDLCCSLMAVYKMTAINDAFLDYFLEEVFAFQSGTQDGLERFLNYWDKNQKKLSVKSAVGNAVQIKTIHKSKGSEFEVVIYPEAIFDLDEKLKSNETPEIWVSPQELGPGFDAIPHIEKVLFKLTKSVHEMGGIPAERVEDEKDSNRLDNLNLLYVAFTRAKQRLYVMAKLNPDEKKENLYRRFIGENPSMMQQVQDTGEGVSIYRLGDPHFHNPRSEKDAHVLEGSAKHVASMDWFSKISLDSSPSMYWASPDDKMQPLEWGNLVHKILSGMHTLADGETALKPYLLEGTIHQEIADMLMGWFEQMARHPLIAAAFGEDAKVKNECEILNAGEIIRPDRYAELPQVIYIIDYKTGKKNDEHHNQLKRYIGALQGMVEKEIRAYLVYLSDEIDVEEVVMDTLF